MTEWFLVIFIYAKTPGDEYNKYSKEKFIDRIVIPMKNIPMNKVCKLNKNLGGLVYMNSIESLQDNEVVVYCTKTA